MKRVVWAGVAAVVLAALGVGVWRVTRERDAIYDDKKAIAGLLAHEDVRADVPGDVTLPSCPGACAAAMPLEDKHVVVVLSKKELRIPANGLVIPIPADQAHGFDAVYKRNGPSDLYIIKLADALGWVREQTGAASIALMADEDTTYRLLIEVLYTAAQSEYGRFFLGARKGKDVVWLHEDPPKAGHASPCTQLAFRGFFADASAPPPPTRPLLCPNVIIVKDGYSVKARGGNIAPGCQDVGAGLTLPKLATGAYDTGGLRDCLARLKGAVPEFASETDITLTANADVPIGAVIGAMGTIEPLFPDVGFGVAR